jgi:hypothetical protein
LAEHWDLPNTGIFYSKDVASVPAAVVLVESLVGLVVLEIVRLEALLLDAAEGFAELAHKVVLLQVGGDVVLPGHAQTAAIDTPDTDDTGYRYPVLKTYPKQLFYIKAGTVSRRHF